MVRTKGTHYPSGGYGNQGGYKKKPYYKKYSKPEKHWTSSYHKQVAPAVGTLAAAAATLVANKYLNSESKHLEIDTTVNPLSSGGTVQLLSGLAQGVGGGQRVGTSYIQRRKKL